MPSLYMLIGVPASGKSTWTKKQELLEDVAIVSSDDIIENIGEIFGLDYNETFRLFGDGCIKLMLRDAQHHFKDNVNVIWDQTNTTKKSRAKKLDMVPDHYTKYAVFFEAPNKEEHERRLASRPGKNIPPNVITNMVETIEEPTLEEGFDQIIYVRANGN